MFSTRVAPVAERERWCIGGLEVITWAIGARAGRQGLAVAGWTCLLAWGLCEGI